MIEVSCLGEAMIVLIPDGDGPGYTAMVGGAESNTACALAALGVPVHWIGRVGDDRFGRLVRDTLAERGVDVSLVVTDPIRPTGLYVKEATATGTRMRYYRGGSAASAMSANLATCAGVRDARLLHVSGITPALSSSCAALMAAIFETPIPGRTVSFDVNWRPGLWTGRDPGALLRCARRADIVFVGADEAHALWGVGTPEGIRELIPEPATLVVKQGEHGATAFTADESVHVPALAVQVVEPTGAGDAFAAGFLTGTLRGLSLRDRLRLGVLAAGSALRVAGDLGVLPGWDAIERCLELDDAAWNADAVESAVAAARSAEERR